LRLEISFQTAETVWKMSRREETSAPMAVA
jgi:hypothetical protein